MENKTLPSHTQAAVLQNYGGPLNLKSIELPKKLEKNKILIKMDVTGICHTDLHVIKGDWENVKAPLPKVPGHEGIGYVIAKGANVTNVEIGDRVCMPWLHSTCQKCEHCLNGWEAHCLHQERTGFSVNGTFSRYAVAVADYVGKIPNSMDSALAAPIACAGVTVYKALKIANLKPDNYVAIVGAAGGLGHLAIQYAKYMGYKTIGIDIGKKEFLNSLGCYMCIDAKNENTTKMIMDATGEGAHAAICLAPNKASMEQAVYYVRPGGSIVLVGLTPQKVEFDVVQIILKGLIVVGSIVGDRNDLQESIDIAAQPGAINCEVEIKPFGEINKYLDKLTTGSIEGRIVLKF